jgi:hypothetical protein
VVPSTDFSSKFASQKLSWNGLIYSGVCLFSAQLDIIFADWQTYRKNHQTATLHEQF